MSCVLLIFQETPWLVRTGWRALKGKLCVRALNPPSCTTYSTLTTRSRRRVHWSSFKGKCVNTHSNALLPLDSLPLSYIRKLPIQTLHYLRHKAEKRTSVISWFSAIWWYIIWWLYWMFECLKCWMCVCVCVCTNNINFTAAVAKNTYYSKERAGQFLHNVLCTERYVT